MKMYWGMEVKLHAFLTSALNGEPLYLWGKSPWYLLGRRLGGPQSQSECCGEKKEFLPLCGIEPQFLSCSL
jgi:hypothetical protein